MNTYYQRNENQPHVHDHRFFFGSPINYRSHILALRQCNFLLFFAFVSRLADRPQRCASPIITARAEIKMETMVRQTRTRIHAQTTNTHIYTHKKSPA